MKISDRFTDYGLIGGFFWLLQCSVLGILSLPRIGSNHLLQAFSTDLALMPTEVVPYVPFLAALLGALALTVIFTTGLLLDLLGSWYFRSVEVRVFISNIRRNKRWLARVIDQNEDYIQDDWSRLLNAPPAFSKTARLVGLKVMVFWNRRYRREYVDTVRQSWALLMPYTRFQAFLLIYVLLTAGVEKIELLNTQMTLWNTSRAIAAAMAIGAIEIGITPLLYIYKPGALNFSFFIFLAVQFALTGLAFAVSHSAYARVCSTLFALTYIVANKTPITIANAATG